MNTDYTSEEWCIIPTQSEWQRKEAEKLSAKAYDVVTVREDFWLKDYKKNGDLKVGAKKTHATVFGFMSYWYEIKYMQELIIQHNAWLVRDNPEQIQEYIRSEICWKTKQVFDALTRHK